MGHTLPPQDGGAAPVHETDVGRKTLWVIRELGLPAIVKTCMTCKSTRHHPTGKFRVNANGKLLDVWLLACCDLCGRTSKIPVHERVHVNALDSARRMMFENNDPAAVRELTMSASLAAENGYRLDWSGTWRLETDAPFHALAELAPVTVLVDFELPAPIRVAKLLLLGFGVSRSELKRILAAQRVRWPADVGATVHGDFAFTVTAPPPD